MIVLPPRLIVSRLRKVSTCLVLLSDLSCEYTRAASAQAKTTPSSRVLGGKRPKRSGLNEKV